jgi:hypothetical protein
MQLQSEQQIRWLVFCLLFHNILISFFLDPVDHPMELSHHYLKFDTNLTSIVWKLLFMFKLEDSKFNELKKVKKPTLPFVFGYESFENCHNLGGDKSK